MITDLVKRTCKEIAVQAKHVKINEAKIDEFVQKIKDKPVYLNFFDFPEHIGKGEALEQQISYVFVLDALNFCFWPSDWEYGDLAKALKEAYATNPEFLNPTFLEKISLEEFKKLVFKDQDFPLTEERHRAVQEIGSKTVKFFEGKFSNILKRAEYDAQNLLELVAATFLMFQDHCIYKGKQVYFYKRAQILVGDLWGMLKELDDPGIGIKNIEQLTCFADYRIPQIMVHDGILEYSDELWQKIDGKEVLLYGSEEEVEIRGCMVTAVEIIRDKLREVGVLWTAIEVDWTLWQLGEEQRFDIKPHHRVLSIFY